MRLNAAAKGLSIALLASVFSPCSLVAARKDFARVSVRNSDRKLAPTVGSVDKSLANVLANGAPGYRPSRVSLVDGHLYVVFASANDGGNDTTAGSSRGFLDVFDSHGNRVRRYAAIEHTDASWELNEYVPVPTETLSRIEQVR